MRVAIPTLCVFALVGAVACGEDEPGSGNDDPLEFPTQARTASLDFSDTDAQYLVTVWSTPGISEASPDAEISFDLAAGGAGTSSVRFARVAKQGRSAQTNGYWSSRLAFEADRRAQIARWAASPEAKSPSVRSEALRAQTCAADGCTQQYRLGNQTRTLNYVDTISEDVRVTVLTDSATADESVLVRVASNFAVAAKKDLDVMGPSGHTGVLDADGGGAITVVFVDNFPAGIPVDTVGAFIFADFLASGPQSNGNHADILWARTPGVAASEDLIVGTLAHEYQHLVSFALRSELGDAVTSQEVLWLDEGLAHLMEDLTGWGGSNVDAMSAALENWNSTPFAGPDDSVAQRGKAYMLLRYLVDVRAKARNASDASDDVVIDAARDIIAPLYTQSRAGFTHALLQDARNDGRLRDWLRAVFVTNNDDVTQSVSTTFLETAASPESNGQRIGFDPFGTYTLASNGDDFTLNGAESDDSDDGVDSAISDSVASSGAHYYIVSGGSGSVSLTLSTDASSVDLNVDAVRIQ